VDLPGVLDPPNYFLIRHSVLLDYRDHPGVPHRGVFIAFGWDKYDNTGGTNRFNFNRFGTDLRGYLPIRSRQQVVAVRGFFVNSDPGPGNRVPFFLQPSLGGGESLRAYDAYRFQGDKLMLLQAEYRWEASRIFELALFGDTGTVANQGHRLDLDKLKSDFGLGFRVKSTEATLFRLDVARGNEGTRFQFRFSQVF
jgi:outer membrane protein assembly factor BamA